MTQKEIILVAFKRGERFMDTNVWERTNHQVSAPSFKRIVSELRSEGHPILSIDKRPENGGHSYCEYYYGKSNIPVPPVRRWDAWRQEDTQCVCGSWYAILVGGKWMCNQEKCRRGR